MISAVYDVSERPITFDILMWLASVGAEAGNKPVHAVILADRWRARTTKDKSLSDGQKLWRVKHILEPACWLLMNTAAVTVVTDATEADGWRRADALRPDTFLRTNIEHWKAGRDIFRFRAPGDALEAIGDRFDDAVVLTIRHCSTVPEKNCKLSAWLRLAGHIRSKGRRAVLIPDTEAAVANTPLPSSFEWFPAAALDLGLRAAVYERAALSMCAGAGPASISMYMPGKRFVFFLRHRGLAASSQVRSFEKVWGMPWGSQLPWAGRGQVLDFHQDDEDVLMNAFDKVMQ